MDEFALEPRYSEENFSDDFSFSNLGLVRTDDKRWTIIHTGGELRSDDDGEQ